jgi:hypothetical protein
MDDKILYECQGKRIILSARRLSDLKLDALVIPAFPDLFPQYTHEFVPEIFSQAGEQDIQDIGNDVAKEYASKHGTEEKEGMPFLVPSGSAHLVKSYEGPLARNLIYVASIDLDEQGKPICTAKVVRDSVRSALAVSEANRFSTIGIPALGKSSMYNIPLETRVNVVANEAYAKLKTDGTDTVTSFIDTVYILVPDPQHPIKLHLMHPAQLN